MALLVEAMEPFMAAVVLVGQLQVTPSGVLFVATTPSSTSKADWSALLERPVVSAAMLLPCAATCPSVAARAAAVARQLPAPARCCPALGLDGCRVVAGGCRVHGQLRYLRVRR